MEVKRDFSFNASSQFQSPFFGPWYNGDHWAGGKIPPGINRTGDRQPSSESSGIRFWFGSFCIEIDVGFSSESLSQLIGTLQDIRFQDGVLHGAAITNRNGDNRDGDGDRDNTGKRDGEIAENRE